LVHPRAFGTLGPQFKSGSSHFLFVDRSEYCLINYELASLYQADRQEHDSQPKVMTPEYQAMRARDLRRRERVLALVAADELHVAEDYYHAAWIMNHGDTPDEAKTAHELALRASDLGCRPACWLAAASYDRWQMYQGKPQKYGTNYVYDGCRHRLWDLDPDTTDEERAAWDVQPLAEQLRKMEEATRQQPPMSADELRSYEASAPAWFREALYRWRAEANLSQNLPARSPDKRERR